MQQTCRQCSASFDITPEDLAFYDKVSPVFNGKKELISPPTLCPACRHQRRLSWRNLRTLFSRACDLTGQRIVSMHAPDAPYPVYSLSTWWGDGWDPCHNARDFNSELSMFAQLANLHRTVPHIPLVIKNCENSDYNNDMLNAKNCYLCFEGGEMQDSLYCNSTAFGKNYVDCTWCLESELIYHSIDISRCYNCRFLQSCRNVRDSSFLYDCRNCSDCFCCTGLRNKQHCFFNEQLDEQEYSRRIAALLPLSQSIVDQWHQNLRQLMLRQPRNALNMTQAEDCSGDYITQCKGCVDCFDIMQAEDMRNCWDSGIGVRCMDANHSALNIEGLYEMQAGVEAHSVMFSTFTWQSHDMYYCDTCMNCHDCFGCASLKHKQYCILNKQYTKEEYEALVPKIIEKMRAGGEWGEFFPVSMSPFAYNETVAQEYFPLSKEEVLARGWQWRDQTDEMPKVEKILPAAQLPDSIEDIPDDILNWAIECDATKRPFKIIKQELEFYRTMRLPVPRFHPDERHRRRMALRNPRKLWERECAKCKKPIATSYAPDRPEIVYCEECYLAEVY